MFLPASLLNEASVENPGYGEESEPEPEAEYSGSMDILTENVVKNMMETELFKEFMDSGSGLEELVLECGYILRVFLLTEKTYLNSYAYDPLA